MQRMVWLALFCLAAVAGLVVVRSVVLGSSAISGALPVAVAAAVEDIAAPLAKGDRLPSRFFDPDLSRTPVETRKIIPSEPQKKSESSKEDIVGWHWHEGSKIVRRRKSP